MINRRSFMKIGGLAVFGGAQGLWASANPNRVPASVSRSEQSSGHTLVVVFLRGGLDGLHALVPYSEDEYYQARPNLAVPKSSVLELDESFALNPAMKALKPLYDRQQLAAVCAVGTKDRSRSHFLAQDFLEYGGEAVRPGWLNRHIREHGLGLATTPQISTLMQGDKTVFNARSVADLMMDVAPPLVFPGDHEVANFTREELDFRRRLEPLNFELRGTYPKTSFGEQLETVAFLLKQGVELEAAHCEIAGFDSHSRQIDGLWPGRLVGVNKLLSDFSEGVLAFWNDLGDLAENVTLLTITEFGRRLQENGSLGTDHGLASASFILGGQVLGGKVYGTWPGLSADKLTEGIDLGVTTDYRALLNEYCAAQGRETLFPEVSVDAKSGMFG